MTRDFEWWWNGFEAIADAPNGVARLREMILSLAVQGHLVPQDANDEPASELLKRIAQEKARLVEQKKIRKSEPLAPVSEDEAPFDLPESWVWVRVGDIGQVVGGGTPQSENSSYFSSDSIPWLTPADLYGLREKHVSKGRRDITEAGLKNSSAQLMPTDAVVFSSRAPIGYVAIAANPLATNQGFKSCVPFVSGISEYLYYFLKHAAKTIDENATGTTFKEI